MDWLWVALSQTLKAKLLILLFSSPLLSVQNQGCRAHLILEQWSLEVHTTQGLVAHALGDEAKLIYNRRFQRV